MNPEARLLRQALKECEQEGRTIDVFFRDDDVDVLEDSLSRMLGLFLLHDVPVNLEVIPGCLTEEAIGWLRARRNERPALIELNQHGWMHHNHEPEGRKYEFGPSRSFEQQCVDLERGWRRMEEAFPGAWQPVFTPPWNRCTAETYRALDTRGYRAISKDRSGPPLTGYPFRELSTSIDLFCWKGGAQLKEEDEIFQALQQQSRADDPIGILLHHKVMDDAAMSLLSEMLDTFSQSPAVRILRFQDLLSEVG